MRTSLELVTFLLFCSASSLMAGVVLEPIPAPEWEVSAWLNRDPGSLRDHRGQVVLIEFFQLWCPGSKEFSIPLLRHWSTRYDDREDVDIVLIHGVFEGHRDQTPDRLEGFLRENGIDYPVGVDAYDDSDEDVSLTMRRYRIGGTPHMAIVDKEGMLRFTHFGIFDPQPVEEFIERLLEESSDAPYPDYSAGSRSKQSTREPGADYSGTYVLRTGMASGECAAWVPPMKTWAELRFYRDSIDIEFAQPLLGAKALRAEHDPRSGRIEGESEPGAGGGNAAHRVVRIYGVLDRQADPPELEVEFSFFDGKCAVQGTAVREP